MAKNTASKRLGRPKRKPKPGERVPLGLRVTAETKQRLDDAAEQSGRSQSQEAELRLDRSFERQDLAEEVLTATYGHELAGLLMILGRTMKDVGMSAGFAAIRGVAVRANWLQNPYAFDQVANAAETIIEKFRPVGDASVPREFKDEDLNESFVTLGKVVAATNLHAVATPDQGATIELKEWGQKTRDTFGPSVSVIESRLESLDKAIVPMRSTSKEAKS